MHRSRRLLVLFVLLLTTVVGAYSIGVSVASFIPRNGSLSHPVSPLSVRDIGISMNDYLGISTSLSLYNINGMGITEPNGSAIALSGISAGPFYTILGSLVLETNIPLGAITISPAGGVFGYYLINPELRSGIIDRYIAAEDGLTTVDSSFSVNGNWGWGYTFGGSITVMVNDQIGVKSGAMYYVGHSPLKLSGHFYADGSSTEFPVPPYLNSAELDFTGIEISLGVTYEM